MSDEDTESRVRMLEGFRTEHLATSKAWWGEQRRWNISINAKIRTLFEKIAALPSEADMHAIEKKLTAATEKQETIIHMLERKKGQGDVIKILVTFALTVAGGMALWALTK